MNYAEFQRIITAFADTKADFDVARGSVLVQVRGEVIEATVRTQDAELVVDDDLQRGIPARRWLVTRIARLPQLADRIIDTIDVPSPLIHPSGLLEDFGERSGEENKPVTDAVAKIHDTLGWRPGGTTSLLYLTSDAGEGKTTIINYIAKQQAFAYKQKQSDWLLLPVSLGGRTFMRFDDVVIAELVNRYRFPFFYYDGFLELVKMGVIVPAFDGFEEMFVEGSTGEALSALGTFLRSLGSNGTALIAARKAYFEFRNLSTRTQLFDAIGSNAVSFARLKLERWTLAQFLEYAEARGVGEPLVLYEAVAERLGPEHALLTRAVLVRRLLDVAESHDTLTALIAALGQAPIDYFHEFVDTILIREVNEKWVYREGEAARPLLTVTQHEDLLALVALEMWISGGENLRAETLDLVADMFCESHGLSAAQTHQVKERLPQHSLLATSEAGRSSTTFDHEDFRKYFLGEALGRTLVANGATGSRTLMKSGTLPPDTCDAAVQHVIRSGIDRGKLLRELETVAASDLPTSFTRENCGALIIRLLHGYHFKEALGGLAFPADALRGRHIAGVTFTGCYWPATCLDGTTLVNVRFEHGRFDAIELDAAALVRDVTLADCEVQSVSQNDGGIRAFDPAAIRQLLVHAGFTVVNGDTQGTAVAQRPEEEEHALVARMLRAFLRNTQVNEETLRRRLGTRANLFFDDVLPELMKAGVVQEVKYLGGGQQRRFKLGWPMRTVEEAMATSHGSFTAFLAGAQSPKPGAARR